MTNPANAFDTPWKQVLQAYFPDFLAFFFPNVYAQVDWTKPIAFLDKELAQVVRDAELGRRWADLLVQVTRLDERVDWLLLHVEVQSQEEAAFAERIFVYHYRIFDRYHHKVVSLVILGDDNPSWRPRSFAYELLGCELNFQFPIVKLLDFQSLWPQLQMNPNPFATVVMAHLKTLETSDNRDERKTWKLFLIQRLYDLGYTQQQVIDLFHFVDWMLTLPDDLDASFWLEMSRFEENRQMPYISSMERRAIAQEALALVSRLLNRRIGSVPPELASQVQQLPIDALESLGEALLDFTSADDLHQWLEDQHG